jgi:putative nucleotidyltransferase with HDIG domain
MVTRLQTRGEPVLLERRKIDVADLQIGMYVAELDRDWVGTPFMFQGFRIESPNDLKRLREVCKFVYIDETKAAGDAEDRTIARSMRVKSGGKSEKPEAAVWVETGAGSARQKLKESLERSFKLRAHSREYVARVFKDVRLGTSINTEEAKKVVAAMVDAVAEDADTMVWMTQLKNVHEYTLQHCVNVCILSLAFAHHLGYPKDRLQAIGFGALMHDIGKIRTPREILDKPGSLTSNEFEIIRRHPVDGWKMLRDKPDIPAAALEIVKFHHERLSGRGYPEGLKGSDLSTHVLLVAVCDVYDAMTSHRVYHKGVSATDGMSALYQLAPSEFGKELVQEFIRCIGIYPVGSLVELASGELGLVMSNDPQNRLRPVVMVVRDPSGRLYSPRRYVALAALGDDQYAKRAVRRIVDPRGYGLDLQGIIVDEVLGSQDSQVFSL